MMRENVARGMNITEVRKNLCALVDEIDERPIAIMRDGKPIAVISRPDHNLRVAFGD